MTSRDPQQRVPLARLVGQIIGEHQQGFQPAAAPFPLEALRPVFAKAGIDALPVDDRGDTSPAERCAVLARRLQTEAQAARDRLVKVVGAERALDLANGVMTAAGQLLVADEVERAALRHTGELHDLFARAMSAANRIDALLAMPGTPPEAPVSGQGGEQGPPAVASPQGLPKVNIDLSEEAVDEHSPTADPTPSSIPAPAVAVGAKYAGTPSAPGTLAGSLDGSLIHDAPGAKPIRLYLETLEARRDRVKRDEFRHACQAGQLLLADVRALLTATESDATAAEGRQAMIRLGELLDINNDLFPAVLPLWRADQLQRWNDLVQPSTLHLCWALGWRAWFFAWRLLDQENPAQPPTCADRPGAVLSAPGLLDALEQRWRVVRRMVRRGLPAVNEDALVAALHNETAAMLRMPIPAADTPPPILGIKARQLMDAISAAPGHWWELSDDELCAQFDAGTGRQQDGAVVRLETPAMTLTDNASTLSDAAEATPISHPTEPAAQEAIAAEDQVATLAALLGGDTAARVYAVARDESKTVDQKQREIYALDNRALAWDGQRWATLLKASASAARNTRWWKEDRKRLSGGD